MNRDAVIKLLKKKQDKRSLREFAADVGVTASYLCDLYLGRRNSGPKILEYLGLEKIRPVDLYIKAAKAKRKVR